MDTEKLNIIVDMLLKLGEGSKEAFIWYLIITYLIPTFVNLASWCVAFFALYKIAKVYFFSRTSAQMLDANLRQYNRLTNSVYLYSSDPIEAHKAISIHASVMDWLQQATGKKCSE